jgi:hypothetical protein
MNLSKNFVQSGIQFQISRKTIHCATFEIISSVNFIYERSFEFLLFYEHQKIYRKICRLVLYLDFSTFAQHDSTGNVEVRLLHQMLQSGMSHKTLTALCFQRKNSPIPFYKEINFAMFF